MCNYIYKELSCQHHYHLVESWCPKYIETQRRCPPTIVSKQYWGDDICAACKERQQPSNYPWAKLIKRPSSSTTASLPTYPSHPSCPPGHQQISQISAR
ncbi:hypothetical protein ACRE_075270 [Hapsidospora chrysogenum ATCC 11550]|uniref:Uncharacterized protein n=1 Tax=Hapsidospora chrysogenum (strain ATCC 11550 / CBS 779.69 / DSM 880 / IAM 14645 / JCM 23072 / IMI 49137) TaxID=857340 RepID=A0A086SXA3_HAPC1|nr:hypothetical protein ACRE_075270 [Hapsidospora chrysogenum ATCC 11550]